jgi:gliding motility-associated-like protein
VPGFTTTRSCEGTAIAFTESSTLNPVNGEAIVLREWDFNYDGVTFNKDPLYDNQVGFIRDLGPAGVYPVALRVTTNGNACSAILSLPVTVDPLPVASFSPSTLAGCSMLPVTFTNTSVAGQPDLIDRFVWEEDAGSGFLSVATQWPADPAFVDTLFRVYENTGTVNRTVRMRLRSVTVNDCETVSGAVTITVFPGTASGFSSTNYSPFNDNCSPVGVNFSVDAATQALSPADYRWQISDPSGLVADVSTGMTPTFSFTFSNPTTSVRDYSVRLTTTLGSGCFGDSTRLIRISPVPASSFLIDTMAFDCQRMRLRITAVQKGLEYHWTVAENGVVLVNSTGSNDVLEHEVTRAALDINLAVGLDTRNAFNCTSSLTTQGVVVPARDIINASFTVTPAVQSLPSATVFITNTTVPGPWTYQWDFGDGTVSTSPGPTLQHTYAMYGVYPITLTVINNVCVETVTETVTIQAIPPVIDFSADPVSGCAPLTVSFTNLSQFAEPGSFVWRFGDGQATSNAINPTYTYYEPGTYTVSLAGSNITSQVVTETKPLLITVSQKPRAAFDVKPLVLYIPGGVLYTRNNSLGAGRFLWEFGDGGTSEETEPQHTYTTEGYYDISLIAISPDNCSDTTRVSRAVKVEQGGTMLVPNAFSPSPNGPTGGAVGNGKNDVFIPLMVGVTQFEMVVFNRWGELLFQTTDQGIGWDGYHKGQLCPQDVYVYKISAEYSNGQRVVRTGDINLIR